MTTPAAAPANTRVALINAGIDAFGRDGYDAVSTRRIADEAGVNAALISYHFQGKEGLYAACVDHIAAEIGARIAPVVEVLEHELEACGTGDPQPCITAIGRLLDALLDLMTRAESTAWARIILREQQDPSPHFETLYAGPMARISRLLIDLCARARGRREPVNEDRLTGVTLVAQVSFFRAHRAAVLRTMGWEDIGREERAQIRAIVHRNIERILDPDDAA